MGSCCDSDEELEEFKEEQKEFKKKVIVIGPSNVGKTTLIQTLMKSQTGKTQPNTVSKQVSKEYPFKVAEKPKQIILNIWDTPGGEKFQHTREQDFANCDCAILVYSIDLESTFDVMDEFLQEAIKFGNGKKPLLLLVGNKSDLDTKGLRQVQTVDAKEFMVS